MKKKILEFQNLSISFQKNQKVVNNLSFSLYEKETLALVGESGSGKSVLTKCIVGLLEPDQGDVIFDGVLRIFDVIKGEINFTWDGVKHLLCQSSVTCRK